jgi:hypothetical protein
MLDRLEKNGYLVTPTQRKRLMVWRKSVEKYRAKLLAAARVFFDQYARHIVLEGRSYKEAAALCNISEGRASRRRQRYPEEWDKAYEYWVQVAEAEKGLARQRYKSKLLMMEAKAVEALDATLQGQRIGEIPPGVVLSAVKLYHEWIDPKVDRQEVVHTIDDKAAKMISAGAERRRLEREIAVEAEVVDQEESEG